MTGAADPFEASMSSEASRAAATDGATSAFSSGASSDDTVSV